jgi:hypothetical protein
MTVATTAIQECVKSYLLADPTLADRRIAKLCNTSHHYVNKLRKKFVHEKGGSPEEKGKEEERREDAKEARRYEGAGISKGVKKRGKDYADSIEKLGEKASRLIDVLIDLGLNSMLMAFQYANIDPKDILGKVEELEDPDKLKEFVRKHLVAMVEASTDATKAILEREEKIRQLEADLKASHAEIESMKKINKDLSYKLRIAEMLIAKHDLQAEYVLALTKASLSYAIYNMLSETTQTEPQAQKATAQKEQLDK